MTSRAPGASFAGQLLRLRHEARGIVQGVGFRPHALRVANGLGLAGWVRNHGAGVTIEVEGVRAREFAPRLRATLPPLARIDELDSREVAVCGDGDFRIAPSAYSDGVAAVPADTALCDACLQELFDADNRRYLHPFIACCDCGPRYTMTRALPYDRQNTSMADFTLCAACEQEYLDPGGRRLHAEPIGCHDCGPRLSMPVDAVARALRDGGIVALQGIGGFHLAVDAHNSAAVARLRERKQRDGKPFAVMLLNASSAARQVRLDAHAARLLEAPQRPVLVADRAATYALPEAIAPGLATLGVMLPYTALHYLLFWQLLGRPAGVAWLGGASDAALVMTSANISGEPMLTDAAQAHRALQGIADLVVTHTREITHGCDDSVLRACDGGAVMLRRARGYAPGAISLAGGGPTVLALGAHLKNTVCVTRGDAAHLSAHIGDLESPSMHTLLQRTAEELVQWLRAEPQLMACDLHPDYASTRLAERLAAQLDVPLVRVQHHHAHIAAVAAAARHEGPLLGLALDGHGMGEDGGSWGGELLRVDGPHCVRLGSLRPIALPGGDRAAREPWRLAAAITAELGRENALRTGRDEPLLAPVMELARSPAVARTSACGRYFDAAAALLGICSHSRFEAEAPMRLEGQCRGLIADAGLFRIAPSTLDLHALFERLLDCATPAEGAALFHGTLIAALEAWVLQQAEESAISTVALGGGCLQNAILARELPARLARRGLTVLSGGADLSPGDGGLSLGQAAVARAGAMRATATPINTGDFH